MISNFFTRVILRLNMTVLQHLGQWMMRGAIWRSTRIMPLALISLFIPLASTTILWEAIIITRNLVLDIGLYMMKCQVINFGFGHCQGMVGYGKTCSPTQMVNTWNFRRAVYLISIPHHRQ